MTITSLVVVQDLDVAGSCRRPDEAGPVLDVDADAELPRTVAPERLEPAPQLLCVSWMYDGTTPVATLQMRPGDAVKLILQKASGGGHMVTDKE